MEKTLRNLIENNIPELNNELYPTNAPEGHIKPYLVYTRITTKKIKTLEGFTNKEYFSFMFSIMATKYGDMKKLTKKVEKLLIDLPLKRLGPFYIEDMDINNIHEVYEHELKVNRGIIDFTIYFEEVR